MDYESSNLLIASKTKSTMKITDTKKMVIKPNINVDNTLGRLTREEYLINNPHGYSSNNKVHKNKKKYNRKDKY